MEAGPLGALPLHREPLLPCVAILCVDLSQHDKFVQVKNKACTEEVDWSCVFHKYRSCQSEFNGLSVFERNCGIYTFKS